MTSSRLPNTLLHLSCQLLAVAWLGGSLMAQAQITGISVSEATLGTRFEIAGSGFGSKPPTVALAMGGQKVPKTALKVIPPSSDGLLTLEVKKALLGTFTILLDPAGKGSPPVESKDSLTIVAPSIVAFDDDNYGLPGAEVSMTVDQAGAPGALVRVGGKKAKIVSIVPLSASAGQGQAQATVAGTETHSLVVFRVPKALPNGAWDVSFSNPVGSSVAKGGLTVIGSEKPLGKPVLVADIEGLSRFRVSGKKKLKVDTSFTGPSTVSGSRGGKKSRSFSLSLPFVSGVSTAPALFTNNPASLHYVETQKGVVTLELMSTPGSISIQVSADADDMVAGSFCGTLYPLTEGGEPREVSGSFTFDGSFELDGDGGLTNPNLPAGQAGPGLNIQILSLSGASGATGNFQPGDRIRVTFRLAKDDGSAWRLEEMGSTRAAVSGPTFNYQRVVPQVSNLKQASIDHGDDTYTYKFSAPIPPTYLPPLNDSASFGKSDGELSGLKLLDGTYTVALWFDWPYSVEGNSFKDVGTTTRDFLLGTSVNFVVPREVVTTANCNQCHGELQFHGAGRRTSQLCVICHTAGSEDRNNPDIGGGTPGASVEFSVMIHKLHNGSHLPSVLGVSTDVVGQRIYNATPLPYQLAGFGDELYDYGDVELPAYPNNLMPMPKDFGYSTLDPSSEQPLEDRMRRGVTNCVLCHGDPDGSGPLQAPAQGELAYTQMKRSSCGSCHDDWVFDRPYTANQQTMPAQTDDATCAQCHGDTGSPLSPRTAHIHPLLDETIAQGIQFGIASVNEAGVHDADGSLDPGEKLAITMFLRDAQGAELDPSSLGSRQLAISGPSQNMNVLLPQQALPAELLTGPQPFTFNPPMRVYNEILGVATALADEFGSAFVPHLNLPGHLTELHVVTGFGLGDTLLDGDVSAAMNFIDVLSASNFERDDWLVLDDGSPSEEYLRIQLVEGNRLWFSSPQSQDYAPGPKTTHTAGATVREVFTIELDEGLHYDLDVATGSITELMDFGTGNTLLSTYSSDFVVPETYPLALNAEPALGDTAGTWADKSVVDGTYSAFVWGTRDLTLNLVGETNSYREGAPGVRQDFLLGDASSVQPYDLIASANSCTSCHVELSFHGNSRLGWQSCLACHGTAGSGDRPQYVAPNAPATDGVTINFRELVHKIHRGSELDQADSYAVVGFGPTNNYPDNFSTHTYSHVDYPKQPAGTADCTSCHGPGNSAWMQPADRDHPLEQGLPVQEWAVVCAACHDSTSAVAHIQSQTSQPSGIETCTICHAPGQDYPVDEVHLLR